MWFEFASAQVQGKRAAQEDAVEVALPGAPADIAPGAAERLVVAVADGMGGHVGGRIASSIVSKRFVESVGSGDAWAEKAVAALAQANQALRTATEKRPELDGMGSTLVGVAIGGDGMTWISIGDTGLFLLSGERYQRLNEDHSFGAYLDEQAASGLITADVAAQDRRRNQLFHALLGDPIEHFECQTQRLPLMPGDVIVVATDGLKTLEDSAVGQFLAKNTEMPVVEIARWLLDTVEAADRPRQDNTTLVVVRVRDGAMPDAPSISRAVGPLLRGVREDTTMEIRVTTGQGGRFGASADVSADAAVAAGADDVGTATRRSLGLVAAVGVVCAGLIGLLWYVLSR